MSDVAHDSWKRLNLFTGFIDSYLIEEIVPFDVSHGSTLFCNVVHKFVSLLLFHGLRFWCGSYCPLHVFINGLLSGHFPYVILSKIYVYKTFCGCQCFSGCSVMIELVSNVHLNPILKKIREEHPDVDTLQLFSDGPTSQYKQKLNFYLLSTELFEHGFKKGYWNFHTAGHAKCIPDGIGASLKRSADIRRWTIVTYQHLDVPLWSSLIWDLGVPILTLDHVEGCMTLHKKTVPCP
jgi:hypothetical protein